MCDSTEGSRYAQEGSSIRPVVLMQYRLVTDLQTDGDGHIAYTVLV